MSDYCAHTEKTDKHFLIDAGSEATPIIGQTEIDKEGKSLKTTQKTLDVSQKLFCLEAILTTYNLPLQVLPEVIIYDVNLTLTLPTQMTVSSIMLLASNHLTDLQYSYRPLQA